MFQMSLKSDEKWQRYSEQKHKSDINRQ